MDRNLLEHACQPHRIHPLTSVQNTTDVVGSDSGLADHTSDIVAPAGVTEQDAVVRLHDVVTAARAAKRPFSWWARLDLDPNTLSQLLVKVGLPAFDPEPAM